LFGTRTPELDAGCFPSFPPQKSRRLMRELEMAQMFGREFSLVQFC